MRVINRQRISVLWLLILLIAENKAIKTAHLESEPISQILFTSGQAVPDEEENEAYNLVLNAMIEEDKKAEALAHPEITEEQDLFDDVNDEIKAKAKEIKEELKEIGNEAENTEDKDITIEDLKKIEAEVTEEVEKEKKAEGVTEEDIKASNKEGLPKIDLNIPSVLVDEKSETILKPVGMDVKPIVLVQQSPQSIVKPEFKPVIYVGKKRNPVFPILTKEERKQIKEIENKVKKNYENLTISQANSIDPAYDLRKKNPNLLNNAIQKSLMNIESASNAINQKLTKDDRSINEIIQDLTSNLLNIKNDEDHRRVAVKLKHLLTMYKEHKNYKNGHFIADDSHFRHLKQFETNVDCIINGCSLRRLNAGDNNEDIYNENNSVETTDVEKNQTIKDIFKKIVGRINSLFAIGIKKEADKIEKFIEEYEENGPENSTHHQFYNEENDKGLYSSLSHRMLKQYLNERRLNIRKLESQDSNADAEINMDTNQDDSSKNQENDSTVYQDEQKLNEDTDKKTNSQDNQQSSNFSENLNKDKQETYDQDQESDLEKIKNNENELDEIIDTFNSSLPSCLTNKDIENISSKFIKETIDAIKNKRTFIDDQANNVEQNLTELKDAIKKGKATTPEDTRNFLNLINSIIDYQIENNATQEIIGQSAKDMEKIMKKIKDSEKKLETIIPVDASIDQNTENMIEEIEKTIHEINRLSKLPKSEFDAEKKEVKEAVDIQFQNINEKEINKEVVDIFDDLDKISNSKFTRSITAENIKFIIHKVLNAFLQDIENLHSDKKKSKFVLDNNDINYIVDNVIQELIKEETENEKKLAKMNQDNETENPQKDRPINKIVENLEREKDMFEQALFNTNIKDKLKTAIINYWNVLINYTSQLKPLIKDSATIKTLTKELEQENVTPSQRLLGNSILLHVKHFSSLNSSDHKFLKLFHRLLVDWNKTSDVNDFESKLEKTIRTLKGDLNPQHLSLNSPISFEHHRFSLSDSIDEIKENVLKLKHNIDNTIVKVKKLDSTIGEGENKLKNVTDVFKITNLVFDDEKNSSGIWSKIKGLFGRKLAPERQLTFDSISSFKNIYTNIKSSRVKANELIKNYETANESAEKFKDLYDKVIAFKGL